MNLDFNWINLLILFGALQGLIFSVILFFNKKHPGARFLSALMFVLAYNGFETFNWSAGLDRNFIFFDLFSFITIFGGGPSLYLYVRSLVNPEQKISRKEILAHYGIVIFQFAFRVGIIVYHILWINKIIHTDMPSMTLINIVWFYSEPLSVTLFVAYVIVSIREYRKVNNTQNIKSISKEGRQAINKWIKTLLGSMIVIAIVWPATVLAPHIFEIDFDVHYYPIELLLVFFIYLLTFAGYHRTRQIHFKLPKIIESPEAEAESEKSLARLQHSMEFEKLYLDPELNLNKLATHTGISAKTISTILNQHRQVSFNDFINNYRVREVRERLIDPANQHLTISGIALESGFNSQATFQRAFKNSTGMSPREYVSIRIKKTG